MTATKRWAVTTAMIVVLGGGAGCAARAYHSDRLPHSERSIRVGFWFGLFNTETMTASMMDWLAERGALVVMRARREGFDPYYDAEKLVKRFKDRAPDLPVLIYDTAFFVNPEDPSTKGENDEYVIGRPEWLIRTQDGKPYSPNKKSSRLYTDPTQPGYREYFAEHVAGLVRKYGADGIALDGHDKGLPRFIEDPAEFLDGERLAREYSAGAEALTKQVHEALGPDKLLVYNGLFYNRTDTPDRLDHQASLLPHADGAAIEFFGRARSGITEHWPSKDSDFDIMVLDYLKVMEAHPDKIIPVYGRTQWKFYLGYEEDYRIQRYDLASYLLGMTPLSTFKCHAHFQSNYKPPCRTWGFAYYADYDLDIGAPVGRYFEKDGVYLRRFEKALAAVAPYHRGDKTVSLEGEWFTPEGEKVSGDYALPDGHGMIFLRQAPAPPPSRVVIDDFEDGEPGEWRNEVRDDRTAVVEEAGNRFLRARLSENPFRAWHERRVQPIRSLDYYDELSLRIRTTDKAGAILLRVEVEDSRMADAVAAYADDPERPSHNKVRARGVPYIVLVIRPKNGTFTFRRKGTDIPYGMVENRPDAPCFEAEGVTYEANGQWQTVRVNLPEVLGRVAPRFAARRVPGMRLIGEADLDDIAIER